MWEVECVVSIGGPGLEAQLSIRSRLCDLGQMLSFSSQILDPVFFYLQVGGNNSSPTGLFVRLREGKIRH